MVSTIEILFQVDRCYKSEGIACTAMINFEYDWPPSGYPYHRLMAGDDAVVLLVSQDNKLTAEDPDGVWMLNGLLQLRGRPEQVLVPQGKAALENDLARTFGSSNPDLRRAGFFYLSGFTALPLEVTAVAKQILSSASSSMDDRLGALALMLSDPKPDTVAIAAHLAETEANSIVSSPRVTDIGLRLRNASDPKCIPYLIRILESRVDNWHYGAISGLRVIGSVAAVPALIKALDERDRLARYAAVVTLFEITKMADGTEYGPGMGPFEEDPERYVRRWKQWWDIQGKAKY